MLTWGCSLLRGSTVYRNLHRVFLFRMRTNKRQNKPKLTHRVNMHEAPQHAHATAKGRRPTCQRVGHLAVAVPERKCYERTAGPLERHLLDHKLVGYQQTTSNLYTFSNIMPAASFLISFIQVLLHNMQHCIL